VTLLLLKGLTSGVLVALVNVLARRNPTLGGVIVGFPMITLLSTFWLTIDRAPSRTIEDFLGGVLWGLIPTFVFVVTIVLGLRVPLSLIVSVVAGALAWAIALGVLIQLGKIGL
jgi:uncharacterized membrane protein (GlpM family)